MNAFVRLYELVGDEMIDTVNALVDAGTKKSWHPPKHSARNPGDLSAEKHSDLLR